MNTPLFRRRLSALLVIVLFVFSFSSTALAATSDFDYLKERGIVNEGEYSPEGLMTRGTYVQWLLKNAGFNSETYTPKSKKRFFDVPLKNNPYAPYIYRLSDLGAIKPPSDPKKTFFFKPNEAVTKKEALEWLFVVEGIPVPKIFDEETFKATDIRVNSPNAPLVNKALALGMLEPGKVRIFDKLKREQAAHFLKTAHLSENTLTVTIVSPTGDTDLTRNAKFQVLEGVWERVFQSYLRREGVDKEKLIYASIEGMLKELDDRYTTFERPGDNAVVDSLSGQLEGIGAVIEVRDEQIVIVSPLSGSPAEKAGLLPEDIIIAVDDMNTKGKKLSEVVAKIKGKKGTQVKITVDRGDPSTVDITVTRDIITIVSASIKRTEDNIAQITLNNFGQNSYKEMLDIVADIKANPPRGIVVDVRNNPGGFLDTSVSIAGLFIESGKKIVDVRYPGRTQGHYSSGDAALAGYKTILLINKGSASASEIIAGALKDYEKATLIGETTFGKGTVQELSDFSDGSTLKMTVAEWLTPDGNLLEKNGVVPDIVVEMTTEDKRAKKDPQMDRALVELRK